jgi:hypothetical protein
VSQLTVHNRDEILASSTNASEISQSYVSVYAGCSCNFETIQIGAALPYGSVTINAINYAGRASMNSISAGIVGTYYDDTKEFIFVNAFGDVEILTTGDTFDILVCNYDPKTILIDDIARVQESVSALLGTLDSAAPLVDQCLIDLQSSATTLNNILGPFAEFAQFLSCEELLNVKLDFQNASNSFDDELVRCTSLTTTEEITTTTQDITTGFFQFPKLNF